MILFAGDFISSWAERNSANGLLGFLFISLQFVHLCSLLTFILIRMNSICICTNTSVCHIA